MFTEGQLQTIKNSTKKVKNQGELAVVRELREWVAIAESTTDEIYVKHGLPKPDPRFTETQWNIIQYCAEECKRQRSGEMSVYDMVNAWDYATAYFYKIEPTNYITDADTPNLTLGFIEHIGTLVEPIDNAKGFRTIPIGIWDGYTWIEKAPWERVPEQLETLIYAYYHNLLFDQFGRDNGWHDERSIEFKAQSAEDMFYLHYENIHPFVDGNGRTGKLLYNYLKGTLDNPVMPPNFWGSSNP